MKSEVLNKVNKQNELIVQIVNAAALVNERELVLRRTAQEMNYEEHQFERWKFKAILKNL